MIWLRFIFSPVGRWLSAIGGVIAAVFLVYLKGRSAGKDAVRREQEEERNRRGRDALEADDRVRRDIASGRLFENDGHRRD